MKDLKAALMEKGFESREDRTKARDKRNGALDRDVVFKKAYEYNKDQYYKIRGVIDAISKDKKDPNVKIVSMNSIHIIINGKEYIVNHSHLRGDRVKLDYRWKKGQEVVIIAKIMPYRNNNNKFELVNIF